MHTNLVTLSLLEMLITAKNDLKIFENTIGTTLKYLRIPFEKIFKHPTNIHATSLEHPWNTLGDFLEHPWIWSTLRTPLRHTWGFEYSQQTKMTTHRRTDLVTSSLLELLIAAKNLFSETCLKHPFIYRLTSFQTHSAISMPSDGQFGGLWMVRCCGCEQVPLSLLRWYSNDCTKKKMKTRLIMMRSKLNYIKIVLLQ